MLDNKGAGMNCLRTNNNIIIGELTAQPGQKYTLDEQCMLVHGDCWKHELKHDQNINVRHVIDMFIYSNTKVV